MSLSDCHTTPAGRQVRLAVFTGCDGGFSGGGHMSSGLISYPGRWHVGLVVLGERVATPRSYARMLGPAEHLGAWLGHVSHAPIPPTPQSTLTGDLWLPTEQTGGKETGRGQSKPGGRCQLIRYPRGCLSQPWRVERCGQVSESWAQVSRVWGPGSSGHGWGCEPSGSHRPPW